MTRQPNVAIAARNRKNSVVPGFDIAKAGNSVQIARQTSRGKPLRVATLSRPHSSEPVQSAESFLTAVSAVVRHSTKCDLLLVAGWSVTSAPTAEAVLQASQGTPVLFEAVDEGRCFWFLAHARFLTLLRRQQIVNTCRDTDRFGRLAQVIASGAGTITVEGEDVRFVLFICGENNAVGVSQRRTIFKSPVQKMEQNDRLAGRWVMLNLAHVPYYPQSRPTGFAKVGMVRGKNGNAGPTLQHLVDAKMSFRDGTESPMAVIHVNNYSEDKPKTLRFAALAFGNQVRRVQGPTQGLLHDMPGWMGSVFEIDTAHCGS